MLLVMAAPQLSFAGTSAAHSNDFKALEVLEASQPPPAPPPPKPVQKPKPPAPVAKPAAPEPSAEAKALDALMASDPSFTATTTPPPRPAAKALAKPVARPPAKALTATKTTKKPTTATLYNASAGRPLQGSAKARATTTTRPPARAIRSAATAVVVLKPPKPVARRAIAQVRAVKPAPPQPSEEIDIQPPPQPEPPKPAVRIARAGPVEKPNDESFSIPLKTVDTPDAEPDITSTVASSGPSADAKALDALIDFTPPSPRAAAMVSTGAIDVQDAPPDTGTSRVTRYTNEDSGRRLDPNEIQKVPSKKIQNTWY